jgi:hypothetical protein
MLAVTAELIDTLHVADCRFEWPPFPGTGLHRLERDGTVVVQGHSRSGRFELPLAGLELPVVGAGRVVGRFVLLPAPGEEVSTERRLVGVALADQLGVALAPAGS